MAPEVGRNNIRRNERGVAGIVWTVEFVTFRCSERLAVILALRPQKTKIFGRNVLANNWLHDLRLGISVSIVAPQIRVRREARGTVTTHNTMVKLQIAKCMAGE